jgi:hypothetical protein
MNIEFWRAIQDSDYQIPEGYTIEQLTETLMSNIGTPHEEMRELAYDILSEWVLSQRYTPDVLRSMIKRLIANLQVGLGEKGTDSVFTRSFSVLLLGETVNLDNEDRYLTGEEVHAIAEAALNYLRAERDTRKFVAEGKGWAQALRHGRYCFKDILRSPHFSEGERASISQTLKVTLGDEYREGDA